MYRQQIPGGVLQSEEKKLKKYLYYVVGIDV
jgi:hypothetical protein